MLVELLVGLLVKLSGGVRFNDPVLEQMAEEVGAGVTSSSLSLPTYLGLGLHVIELMLLSPSS